MTVTPPPTKLCQAVGIPAYFYPSDGAGLWGSAVAAEPGIGMMIANVDKGPGTPVDTDYTTAITNAQGMGVSVFGYVYTSYAGRSLARVESDISAWRTLYGVTNIFLDEASTSSSSLSYYQALSNYVHQAFPGALDRQLRDHPRLERDERGRHRGHVRRQLLDLPEHEIPNLGERLPADALLQHRLQRPGPTVDAERLSEAAGDHVGYVYATNDGLPKPYDTLPSYLNQEASQARNGC